MQVNLQMSQRLSRLESFSAIANILHHPVVKLSDFQSADLVRSLYEKSAIIMYDTGMGKTVLSAAIMKALSNIKPAAKFLFFGKNAQMLQTPDKIRDLTGFEVLALTAQQTDIEENFWGQRIDKYKIIFLTFETLNNPLVMRYLHQFKHLFEAVFVDEAHEISNFTSSSSAMMLRGILRNFEYRYALTATPITSRVEQFADLVHMFDWEAFPDVRSLYTDLKMGRNIAYRRPGMFINRNRDEQGMATRPEVNRIMVDPMPHQVGAKGMHVTRITKGEGAVVQAEKLVEIVKSRIPYKGLVYINMHEVREWVLPFFDRAGIKYGCINGFVTGQKRKDIEEAFNSGQLDVVITSVTTSLDLECDYVTFYEYSADIKQMIGRAHRGLNPKDLILDFIFTRGTGEVEYFIEFIYRRSLIIQQIIGKDYSELIKAGEELVLDR